jgi:hypothetical protein
MLLFYHAAHKSTAPGPERPSTLVGGSVIDLIVIIAQSFVDIVMVMEKSCFNRFSITPHAGLNFQDWLVITPYKCCASPPLAAKRGLLSNHNIQSLRHTRRMSRIPNPRPGLLVSNPIDDEMRAGRAQSVYRNRDVRKIRDISTSVIGI